MARDRRLFGPLFYSTAVFAIVAVLYACWLRVEERLNRVTPVSTTVNVEALLGGALHSLSSTASNERLAGAAALANLLRSMGPGDFTAGQHARAVAALEGALKDPDSAVRAQAASGLAVFVGSARQAKAGLSAALSDEDPDVRYNAALALMPAGGELTASALATLSALVTGEEQPAQADRARILNTMAAAGAAGVDAARAGLRQLLTNRDPGIRRVALMCAAQLEPSVADRVRLDVEPLLKDKDPEVRCAAALALLQSLDSTPGGPGGPAGGGAGMVPGFAGAPGSGAMMAGFTQSAPPAQTPSPAAQQYPQALEALEHAVADVSLPLASRSDALAAVFLNAAGSLRKCGLELARQLSSRDRQARLDAARLLHMIDDQSLAGPLDDEAGNDKP
jgi:HEAT repeat protein